jgi:integrase
MTTSPWLTQENYAMTQEDYLLKKLIQVLPNKKKKRPASCLHKNSFELIAREWFSKFSSKWTEKHAARTLRMLEKELFPWIGKLPITEISAPTLLTNLRRIENRGAIETAHRTHQICGKIFRYAIATRHAERDTAADLRGALPPDKNTMLP